LDRFTVIVLTTICFCFIVSVPGWHYEHDDFTGEDIDVRPFPSKPTVNIILATAISAAMLILIASLWQHTGAVAACAVIESVGYGSIKTSIGPTAMALGWSACGLLFGLSIWYYIMRDSMMVLDGLMEE
jgi:hypothetical protein